MNRRHAVKKLILASGTLITLPLWMTECGHADTTTHLSSFNSKEQELIAAITDTFIPAGNAIGALSMGVDKFLQKILDDCYEKAIRDDARLQLHALDAAATSAYQHSFPACTQQEREQLLLRFATSAEKTEKDFYTLMRTETIRGFTTSRQVMQDYLHYQIAPGHYYGCVTNNG